MSVYLSLGSNIGDRKANLIHAVEELKKEKDILVLAVSQIFETTPMDFLEQPNFLNVALRCESNIEPLKLLKICQKIEKASGRVKTVRFGPRLIDIDIVFWDGVTLTLPELSIPHLKAHERGFVLIPLQEVWDSKSRFLEDNLKNVTDQKVTSIGILF